MCLLFGSTEADQQIGVYKECSGFAVSTGFRGVFWGKGIQDRVFALSFGFVIRLGLAFAGSFVGRGFFMVFRTFVFTHGLFFLNRLMLTYSYPLLMTVKIILNRPLGLTKLGACAGMTIDWPVFSRLDLSLITISASPSMI